MKTNWSFNITIEPLGCLLILLTILILVLISGCTNPTYNERRYCVVTTQTSDYTMTLEVPYDMYDCSKRGGKLK